jgi:hypothetical protein
MPESISNATSLVMLYASSNVLSGPIPASIGQLTNLQFLTLGDNKLSGKTSRTQLPLAIA